MERRQESKYILITAKVWKILIDINYPIFSDLYNGTVILDQNIDKMGFTISNIDGPRMKVLDIFGYWTQILVLLLTLYTTDGTRNIMDWFTP